MTEPVTDGGAGQSSDRRFLSLGQWLFVLLAAFVVVPLFISNLWGYFQSRRYLTEATFRNVRNVAELEASHVALYVQNAEELFAANLSADRHLADLARMLSAGDENARRRVRGELTALQAKMSGLTGVEQIQILSPTGTVLVSTLADDGSGSGAAPPACQGASADGKVIAGVAEPGQKPSLLLAGAITGDRDERLGIVCARFRFDIHRYLVQSHRERTPRGALYLLDENGEIVDESFGGDGHRARYGEQFRSRGRTLGDLGHSWVGRYTLDSGVEELAAYAPIPSLGWGVAVEVPVAHALLALRRLERQAALITFVVALLVIAAAIWSWRVVVSPLQSLSSAAERMAAGATGETVKPGGSREIAELAKTFNRMSLALWESKQALEQRIAERTRELGETREFAELLLNSIDHRVIVVDRAFRIIKANAAAVRMHGPDLVGTPYYRAFEGLSEPRSDSAAARTFATGRAASEARSQQTSNGREPVEMETYPVFGSDGQVESVIEIARIVTAEKQIQVQMMHQEKMAAFGLLAAGIAHDIGNPLAAIESQLQLARQQPQRQGETITVVSKEVARISRMLRELIDFARRRRDALTLVSANQVVEDVTRLLTHDPRARRVAVAHHLAPKVPGIRTTEDHLFQVLLNLGLNGLDAMPDGGTLEFETHTRSGWVLIRVRDTGSGIPADLRHRLFEPFFTTKAPERGTGLGLFVSKGIIESMGGELRLEQSDGRGTVFAILLPVQASADAAVSA